MNYPVTTEPSVICHCSPETHCPNGAVVCWSTTGCFHSLKLDEESLQYAVEETFGCFANHTNQVDLHCRDPVVKNPLVYCCTPLDGDYCNANLGPHIARSQMDAFFSWRNAMSVTIALLLPLCTLIVGLVAIGLLWQCVLRARLQRQKTAFDQIHPPRESVQLRKRSRFRSLLTPCCCHRTWSTGTCPKMHPTYQTVPVTFTCPTRSNPAPNANIRLPTNHERASDLAGCTSGSGSGQPFLVQRTVARHIQLLACIGKGRFGEVWRATCQGEVVAVKIFSSRDESSWARETEVYNTGLLRHPNLLAYYASDMISRGGCTQLWLVTAYHANGSLHDYLNHQTLSLADGLRLARSISAGLAFLHTEIQGLQAKPPIAHRDIKSKNVLVRDDKEACIADLGLALVRTKPTLPSSQSATETGPSAMLYSASSGTTQSDYPCFGLSGGPSSFGHPQPAGPRVGTKRYMAPELLLAVADLTRVSCVARTSPMRLEHELDFSDLDFDVNEGEEDGLPADPTSVPYLPFEVYQAADIYAMSLVFWEILRCTRGVLPTTSETVEGYQIPYQDMVPADPTFAQMRKVVCADLESTAGMVISTNGSHDSVNRLAATPGSDTAIVRTSQCRPAISERWLADPYLSRITRIVQECWHRDWSARLAALRVRKSVEAIELNFSHSDVTKLAKATMELETLNDNILPESQQSV